MSAATWDGGASWVPTPGDALDSTDVRPPSFDDQEIEALLDLHCTEPDYGVESQNETLPTISCAVQALSRGLAAQHLEILALCAANAIEGRRQRREPRFDRAIEQTVRLARETEDEPLLLKVEHLAALFVRVTESDATDLRLYGGRLRDTMLELGELAGGDAEARLQAICLRRRGLHPLAARLRALRGIGNRRLTRLSEAGLLTLESLVDADPDDLVSAAKMNRALADRVIAFARDYAEQRATVTAEVLEDVAAEALSTFGQRHLSEDTRARLLAAADSARASIDLVADGAAHPESAPAENASDVDGELRRLRRPPCKALSRLGSGGEAEVVRSVMLSPGGVERVVALKRLRSVFANHPFHRARIAAEGQVLAHINHPNVVTLLEVLRFEGEPQLALELLPGANLSQLLERAREQRRPLTVREVVSMGTALCDGLQAVHEQVVRNAPLAHGDVAPGNVMLTRDGRLKFIDFGVAALQELGLPEGHALPLRGHLGYLAPELWADEARPTPAGDQFALATLLWEALTLRRLFGAGDELSAADARVDTHVEQRFARCPWVPAPLQEVLRRGLDGRPEARYASIREFGDALRLAGPEAEGAGGPPEWVHALRELVPVPWEAPLDGATTPVCLRG